MSMLLNPFFAGPGCETQPASDPDWASVSALLHFDGSDTSTTFTDETGKTWTAAGAAQLSTSEVKLGTAAGLFDGVDSYISTPDHADFDFGSGDFTIDAWVRLNAAPSAANIISQRGSFNINHSFTLTISSGELIFQHGDATGANGVNISTSGLGFPLTQWKHCAAVRSGNDLFLFVDGVLKHTGSVSITLFNSTAEIKVGVASLPPAGFLDGRIDELRVTKGVARYTSNFLPQCNEFGGA